MALVARARKGDEAAFRALFDRYAAMLSRHVERSLHAGLRRKLSAADLLQEVRLAAFLGLGGFEAKDKASFRNWLFAIAENRVGKAVRMYAGTAKRACAREVSKGARADTAQVAGAGPSPSEAAIASEQGALVRAALRTLSPDHREILRLAVDERLSLREAAERMGRSREAAKKLYGRALASLGRALEAIKGGLGGSRG